MTDADLLALNIYMEAAGEVEEGRAAVARVVKDRMRAKFYSDGTIAGTVLAKDQFSWAWFDFVTPHTGNADVVKSKAEYVRVCDTLAQAQARADDLLKRALPKTLQACRITGQQVMAGVYYGVLFSKLGNEAVSYLNPRILTKLPKWATPEKFLVSIGHHDFYRA